MKIATTKIYLIRSLYNLQMEESDLDQAHLNEYESINSQISGQGMTIDDELMALLLMSSVPPLWETFGTTMCNVSSASLKYSKITSSILMEATQRKSFVHNSASE